MSESELLQYLRTRFGVSIIYGKRLCRLAGYYDCPDDLRPDVTTTIITAAAHWAGADS